MGTKSELFIENWKYKNKIDSLISGKLLTDNYCNVALISLFEFIRQETPTIAKIFEKEKFSYIQNVVSGEILKIKFSNCEFVNHAHALTYFSQLLFLEENINETKTY